MKNRREFIGDSAKILASGIFGIAPLMAENSSKNTKDSPKDSANWQDSNNTKGTTMQFTTLNNGVKMPILGLDTYGLRGNFTNTQISDTALGLALTRWLRAG